MSSINDMQVVPPKQAGFSGKRLERVSDVVHEHIENGDLPGAITMVVRRDKLVYYDVQGYRDIETKKPLENNCIFRMYSMTKPVTATAIMMLYEEDKLMLDEPVARYLPAFANQIVITDKPPTGQAPCQPRGRVYTEPIERDMTIRDLLTHSAGIASTRQTPAFFIKELSDAMKGSNHFPNDDGSLTVTQSVRQSMDKLARIPLSFQPGTNWNYGFEFAVLGLIIETITGKTLEEFFQERIFQPLGMIDSSFNLPESKIERLITEHAWDESWRLKIHERPQDSIKLGQAKNLFYGTGSYGGILSTAPDYLRFCRMLSNRGELDGFRLLSPKSVELMTANHTDGQFIYVRGYGWGYGFGLGIKTDLTESNCIGSIGAYGWSGLACTYFVIDPAEQLIGLALSQVLNYSLKPGFCFHQQFEKAVYQALEI